MRLFELADLDLPRLKYKRFVPYSPADLRSTAKEDIFALIRREDVLLIPSESFQPVVDFLRTAAVRPQVLAVKITLYRVGKTPRLWTRC
jgi:polyphosphate kinase